MEGKLLNDSSFVIVVTDCKKNKEVCYILTAVTSIWNSYTKLKKEMLAGN